MVNVVTFLSEFFGKKPVPPLKNERMRCRGGAELRGATFLVVFSTIQFSTFLERR